MQFGAGVIRSSDPPEENNLFISGNVEKMDGACGNQRCQSSLLYAMKDDARALEPGADTQNRHSRARWCRGISHPQTCDGLCTLSWQRAQLLNWMNKTCSPVVDWDGLPSNWTSLVKVSPSDLNPWYWNVTSRSNNEDEEQHCPSSGALLGAFAAINIVLALLTPISGRRTVIKRVTFGCLGNLDGDTAFPIGILIADLNIMVNFLNAVLISKTPGYEAVSVVGLGLLWCTRPRLAWIVVALAPWGRKEGQYLSSAASSLVAELVLQLVSAYVFGHAANYGRRQRFYNLDRVGRDGLTMYAGAAMWLGVVIFALVACFNSVTGLTERIEGIVGRIWQPISAEKEWNCRGQYVALRDAAADFAFKVSGHNPLREGEIRGREQDQRWVTDHVNAHQEYVIAQREAWQGLSKTWETLIETSERMEASLAIDEEKYERRKEDIVFLHPQTRDTHDAFTRFKEAQRTLLATPRLACNTVKKELQEASRTLESLHRERQEVRRKIWQCRTGWDSIMRALPRLTASRNLKVTDKPELTSTCEISHLDERFISLKAICDQYPPLLKALGEAGDRWQAVGNRRKRLKEEEPGKAAEGWVVGRGGKEERRLRRFVYIVLIGMTGCWIAQWVWWVGYVRSMGELYCPPRLTMLVSNWIIVSVVGLFLGASA
ncbi:hypothetical protein QBC44DRAFT_144294 [Cladorrhinum sp. PSN332]|nr:hypothetical protein QBC44DRAFT_144294 [Cladorrhinum sp. PSN332]